MEKRVVEKEQAKPSQNLARPMDEWGDRGENRQSKGANGTVGEPQPDWGEGGRYRNTEVSGKIQYVERGKEQVRI
jgi:hypothetical protein